MAVDAARCAVRQICVKEGERAVPPVTYYILVNPGHNRVYLKNSQQMALAELQLLCSRFAVPCRDFARIQLAGGVCDSFIADEPLPPPALDALWRLSDIYALFSGAPDGLLRPIQPSWQPVFDEGISTILKYTGKTNELFTRMLINVARLSSDYADAPDLWLLDPIAGKGTTLFEGMRQGMDCCGIEIASKSVQESVAYLKKYLQTERFKHTYKKERRGGKDAKGASFTAALHQFTYAADKQQQKQGGRQCIFAAGDSTVAPQIYKKGQFHLIVGDLPYGVAHGNVSGPQNGGKTRNPTQLLRACLPGWRQLLRPGGAIALSWNSFLLGRDQMRQLFAESGFEPCTGQLYDSFEHPVSQAIRRDIVVARRLAR